MMRRRTERAGVISGLLLAIGLSFALLGQFYFVYRREFWRDGLFFWGVAILAFGLLLRLSGRERCRGRSGWWIAWVRVWARERPARLVAAMGGASLAVVAGWLARRRPESADFGGLLWMWLFGVCWLLLAFVPLSSFDGIKGRFVRWVRAHRDEIVGMLTLLVVALAVRAIDLEHIPANLGGDEGTQGVAALRLVIPPLGNPFSTGWFSVPTMSFLAYGVSMRLFGASIAGLRALSALAGTITVLTTFLLAWELWGERVAWLAAIALTFSHFHIHFSRLGSNQVIDGLFITLALYFLMCAMRSGRAIYFALAGAVIGWGWYGYFGARLVGVVAVLYLAWRALVTHRFWARYRHLLLLMVGVALVVMAPLLFHYLDHPAELVSRARQVNIFSSGWLRRELEITGRSVTSLLLQQFWKSISAFNYTLDPTFWYHAQIPLLDLVSGIFFVLGLIRATVCCRWPTNGLALMMFWSALILGWVITENPPSSMRLAGAAPTLALLVALGLDWLIDLVSCFPFVPTVVRRWLTTGVLVAIVFSNMYYYFFVYTPSRVYGNPNAEVATDLGRYLVQQDDDDMVYFCGPPSMYWDFGALAFIARGVEGVDVPPLDETRLPDLDLARGARFVLLPERLGDLDIIRERYPGGVERRVYSSADSRLLYVLYEVGG